MSADNYVGVWFDGKMWRVESGLSASMEFTSRAQLEEEFKGARYCKTRENALALAHAIQKDAETEYGVREIETPLEQRMEIAYAADVRERFEVVEKRIDALETKSADALAYRIDSTEKAIIGHEGEIQKLTAAMRQFQTDTPAWLKLVASVERSVDRLDMLEAAAKPKPGPALKRHDGAQPLRFVCVALTHAGMGHKCGKPAPRFYYLPAGDGGMSPLCEDHARQFRAEHVAVYDRETAGAILIEPTQRETLEKGYAIRAMPPPIEFAARPTIVCLCGSTKFFKAFRQANLEETLIGKIVLTVGSMMHSDADIEVCIKCRAIKGTHTQAWDEGDFCEGTVMHRFRPLTAPEHAATKAALDALHRDKIQMADEVFVLNAMRCTGCGGVQDKSYDNWGHHTECKQFRSSGPFTPRVEGWKPYIGESTRNEIEHALRLKKRIRFLNPHPPSGATLLYENDTSGNTVEQTMRHLGLAEPERKMGEISNVTGTAARVLRDGEGGVRRNATPVCCDTCIHKCMDMDMDPYCIAVNKPYGQVLTRPRPKECAGEDGKQYLLWQKDTRR